MVFLFWTDCWYSSDIFYFEFSSEFDADGWNNNSDTFFLKDVLVLLVYIVDDDDYSSDLSIIGLVYGYI